MLERLGERYSLSVKRTEQWNPIIPAFEDDGVRTQCRDLWQPSCYLKGKANRNTLTNVPSRTHKINEASSEPPSSDFWLLEQYVSLSFRPLLIVFLNICSLMHANRCGAEISKH